MNIRMAEMKKLGSAGFKPRTYVMSSKTTTDKRGFWVKNTIICFTSSPRTSLSRKSTKPF